MVVYYGKATPASGSGGGSGAAVWGAITGTLANQTDLQNALNEKQASLSSEQITATNSGITSALVTQIGTNASNISTLQAQAGNAVLTTTAQTLSGAINELDGSIVSYSAGTGILINNDVISADGTTPNTVTLATVATSGDYTDLSNKPTIPTVNNATLTITQDGTTVGTFTANASSDVIIALTSGSSVDIDDSTITENAQNKIQAVGVINQNTTAGATTPLKLWEGTEAEYNNSGVVKDTYYGWENVDSTWNLIGNSHQRWCLIYAYDKFITLYSNSNLEYSSDGQNWTRIQPLPEAQWRSVAYGNGKLVAVANGGSSSFSSTTNIGAISSDGTTWSSITLPSAQEWYSVTYGNGMFVVVANNTNIYAYSSDGINWTESTLPSSGKWSIGYGNGLFIVYDRTDYSTKYAYSSDGVNWTESTLPANQDSAYSHFAYGNGTFVITSTNYAAYSTDGIIWNISQYPHR